MFDARYFKAGRTSNTTMKAAVRSVRAFLLLWRAQALDVACGDYHGYDMIFQRDVQLPKLCHVECDFDY